jgi:hypothetical protein
MWGDEFLRYLVLGVFRILLHVFFNDVEVVGRLNVPKKGPVIFVGTLTTPSWARVLSQRAKATRQATTATSSWMP